MHQRNQPHRSARSARPTTAFRAGGFEPHPLIRGGHLQTVMARLLRSKYPPGRWRRHRLELEDGDFLDLDLREPEHAEARFSVLVLHGLEGCSDSGYVRSVAREIDRRGGRTAALNFRGRSGEPNRTVGAYHAGRTDDVGRAVRWLRRSFPDQPAGAVGFSLGGNALLKWLGELGDRAPLEAAAAVSVPYDLAACARRLDHGVGRVYSRYFLGSLIASARSKAERYPALVDVARIDRVRTVREFDDRYTAPVHGFENAEAYYAASSSAGYLEAVRVPALLLHALDDPLIPGPAVPHATIASNPWLEAEFTRTGGHVGFISRLPSARFWAEARAAEWLAARLAHPGTRGVQDASRPPAAIDP